LHLAGVNRGVFDSEVFDTTFNVKHFLSSAYLCVLYISQNKQRLFTDTSVTGWCLLCGTSWVYIIEVSFLFNDGHLDSSFLDLLCLQANAEMVPKIPSS